MATLQSRSVRRREDVRLLTGKGNYSADPHPPGMLHAVLVRSHHAHAAIGGIDIAAARAMPGVVAVFTAADLTDVAPIPGGIGFPRPDGGPAPKTDRPLLAADRVRFVGEPVAVVLAETLDAGQGRGRGGDGGLPRTAAGHRCGRRAGAGRAEGVGRRARQHRLPVEARRCRRRPTRRCGRRRMSRGCSSPSRASPPTRWSRAAPGREVGADGRMVVHAAHQSPYNLRNGMANGNFSIKPTDIRVLAERCRRLVRHEVGRAAGIRAGGLGGAQAGPAGALDLRSHRGFPHRRAGARDAHHASNWRWMPTAQIHRAEAALGRQSRRLRDRPLRLAGRQYRRHRRRLSTSRRSYARGRAAS